MTGSKGTLPRCKPFKYTYEKEIVMYDRPTTTSTTTTTTLMSFDSPTLKARRRCFAS
jgi:hypothetical protein